MIGVRAWRPPCKTTMPPVMTVLCSFPRCFFLRASFWRAVALALVLALLSAGPAAATNWKPARVTILLGQSAQGLDGRLSRALAREWSLKLLAPVVVTARGRAGALATADAFTRVPRDGTVVMAADLGRLALDYARARPSWVWGQIFEHLGVFGLDPVFLFTVDDGPIATLDAALDGMRTQVQPIGVGQWGAIENLALQDMARRAGLRFAVQPLGSGDSLVAAVMEGSIALALGRASDLSRHRADIRVLAELPGLGSRPPAYPLLDDRLGVRAVPAGRTDVIIVHARLRRDFPERFEVLQRSLAAAVASEAHKEALSALGLHRFGVESLENGALMETLRQWWDAAARVSDQLAAPPPPVQTRGRISRVSDGGRRIEYLGLDGKSHELRADPDATEVGINGVAPDDGAALARLRRGMICEIVWPGPAAREASRLSCKSTP